MTFEGSVANTGVVITARGREHVANLASKYGDRALALSLDVTKRAQIDAAIEAAAEHFGGVDVLGRVEDGRGSLGHLATLRFPSPLIEPDVPD